MKPAFPNAKGWRTAVAGCCAMLIVGLVAVTTHDLGIIAAVSGAVTTILGIVSQRHTAADLYASSPNPPTGRHNPASPPDPAPEAP